MAEELPKRPRQDSGATGVRSDQGTGGTQPVGRSELEAMLDIFKTKISSETKSAVAESASSIEQGLKTHVTTLLRTYDDASNRRIASIEATTQELTVKQNQQEKDMENIKKDIGRLQQGLVVAESATPSRAMLDAEDFDREPDLTIVKISVADAIAKGAAIDALATIFQTANIAENEYVIKGPELGKYFTLQLNGEGGVAAKRAKKFLSALRDRSGKWTALWATTPTRTQCRIYINEDKSDKRTRTEMFTKRLERAFKTKHADKHVHARRYNDKKEGTISVDWVPVAKLTVASKDDQPVLLWNAGAVAEMGIEKDTITTAFNSSTGSAAAVQWSV